MEIKLKPWQTPNFVYGIDPANPDKDSDALKWSIKDIDALELINQCDVFRAEIFKKAGKVDPRKGVNR